MSDKERNWSFVVKNSSSAVNNNIDSWPQIGKTKKNAEKIKINFKSEVDTAVKILQNLNIQQQQQHCQEKSSDKIIKDDRAREQILQDRKIRKNVIKEEKKQQKYEKQVAEIRAPKSQKVTMIGPEVLELYRAKGRKENMPDTSTTSNNKTTQIKKILKNKNTIKVNLIDFVVTRQPQKGKLVKKTITKSTSGKVILRSRGKKREIAKKKCLPALKRNILKIRQQRQANRNIKAEINDKDIEFGQTCEKESVNTVPIIDKECPFLEAIENHSLKQEKLLSKSKIFHSRKFRPYCNNFITPELCQYTESILQDLFRFQKRAYEKNEIKARAHRRFVVGFKEVGRNLEIAKIKLLIIAPDMEPNEGDGGIDETVREMIIKADQSDIPYVFSIKRRRIGFLLFKKVPVSCVGILDYSGVEENVKLLIEAVKIEREKYKNAQEVF